MRHTRRAYDAYYMASKMLFKSIKMSQTVQHTGPRLLRSKGVLFPTYLLRLNDQGLNLSITIVRYLTSYHITNSTHITPPTAEYTYRGR